LLDIREPRTNMWPLDQILLELDPESEKGVVIIKITTPAGRIDLIGEPLFVGRVLIVNGAHVSGLTPGACTRAGLNAIGRKLLEWADVDEIVIQGSIRTTGRNAGRAPRIIRFPKN